MKELEKKPPLDVVSLAVNGHDVMEVLGVAPGHRVGEVLNHLLEMVLEEPELNNVTDLVRLMQTLN